MSLSEALFHCFRDDFNVNICYPTSRVVWTDKTSRIHSRQVFFYPLITKPTRVTDHMTLDEHHLLCLWLVFGRSTLIKIMSVAIAVLPVIFVLPIQNSWFVFDLQLSSPIIFK